MPFILEQTGGWSSGIKALLKSEQSLQPTAVAFIGRRNSAATLCKMRKTLCSEEMRRALEIFR